MRRHERSEQERRGIVEDFVNSEEPLVDYCSSRGISIHQYYKWRREVYGPSYKKRACAKGSFIEFTSSAPEVSRDWALEVEVSGVTIRVRR